MEVYVNQRSKPHAEEISCLLRSAILLLSSAVVPVLQRLPLIFGPAPQRHPNDSPTEINESRDVVSKYDFVPEYIKNKVVAVSSLY